VADCLNEVDLMRVLGTYFFLILLCGLELEDSGSSARTEIRRNLLFVLMVDGIRLRMVSMARSEYCCCLLCVPLFADIHALMADGESQRVKEPLPMRFWSYSGQFLTVY